jgi:hypothetical protein
MRQNYLSPNSHGLIKIRETFMHRHIPDLLTTTSGDSSQQSLKRKPPGTDGPVIQPFATRQKTESAAQINYAIWDQAYEQTEREPLLAGLSDLTNSDPALPKYPAVMQQDHSFPYPPTYSDEFLLAFSPEKPFTIDAADNFMPAINLLGTYDSGDNYEEKLQPSQTNSTHLTGHPSFSDAKQAMANNAYQSMPIHPLPALPQRSTCVISELSQAMMNTIIFNVQLTNALTAENITKDQTIVALNAELAVARETIKLQSAEITLPRRQGRHEVSSRRARDRRAASLSRCGALCRRAVAA